MCFEMVEGRLMDAHILLAAAGAPLTSPVRTRSDAAHLIGIARARITQALDALMQAETAVLPTDRPPASVTARGA